jgi:hypothetical protein
MLRKKVLRPSVSYAGKGLNPASRFDGVSSPDRYEIRVLEQTVRQRKLENTCDGDLSHDRGKMRNPPARR